MKKILTIFLTASLLLVACGKDKEENLFPEYYRKLKDLKVELFNLRFQLATGQLENPMRIGGIRKDIARVKTIIRERELNAGKEA